MLVVLVALCNLFEINKKNVLNLLQHLFYFIAHKTTP